MFWYKLAQKIQQRIQERGLKPEDLFSFYSMQSLSSETFEENPDILYDFIESINSIKEYYLKFLIPRIVRELGHAIDDPDAIEGEWQPDEGQYSFSDWIEENGIEQLNDQVMYSEYFKFMEEEGMTLGPEISASEKKDIKSIQKKTYGSINLSNSDFDTIQYLFGDLPWSSAYGGEAWVRITEWTKKLYNVSEINVSSNIDLVLSKAQYLVYILDTIHSLHHNNALALSELPHSEGQWIIGILELVKYAKEPLFLSYFSNNPELVRVVYKEAALKGGKLKSQREFIYDILVNMSEKNRYIFLRSINHRSIADIILTFDVDLIKYIIFNSGSNIDHMRGAEIFMQLVQRYGLKNTLSSLPLRIGPHSVISRWLSQDMLNEIKEFYDNQGIIPNREIIWGSK